MKVLVTGAAGILGTELRGRCPRDFVLAPFSRAELEVTDRAAVHAVVARERPDWVVHCAAMTAVDECETEPDRAFRVNWLGTQAVAEACAAQGACMVYLSSDYVFDGAKDGPYLEYDPTGPLSVYGKSKLWGERAVAEVCSRSYVLRTQWVYGRAGKNFVDTMRQLAGQGKPLRVVEDQRGCPTFAGHLAESIYTILRQDPGAGVYHVSGGGQATWFELAREIFRILGLSVDLSPCSTAEFPRPAPRPRNAVLRNYRLELTIGDPMPSWQEGLRAYLS